MGLWNVEINPEGTLIDFDSSSGVIKLGDLGDTATITSVEATKNGAKFNGTTSGIDLGILDNRGAKSTAGWIKAYSFGENNAGHILSDEDYFNIFISSANDSLGVTRNGGTPLYSANNSIKLNKWIFYYIESAADGTTSIYLGDRNTAPILSSTGAAGSPVISTKATHIGNRTTDDRSFHGFISILKDIEGSIGINTATQLWSNTLKAID